jgi:hypothetical protein
MREYFNAVKALPNLPTDLANATDEAIAKLDARNAAKAAKPTKVQVENEPIAKAIVEALAEGEMLGVDLAAKLGITVNKANGVAGNLVKSGVLTKTKVKVKGKGEMTAYSLTPSDEGEVAEG